MATLTEIKTETEHYFEDESGKKQGEYKTWYSNGQLDIHCYYVDGILHGEYKWWYENGQPWVHCFYVDGKRHGEFKAWHSNGQQWEHCYYVDGKKQGEYKAWYPSGQIWEHCFYQNGEVVVNFTKNPDLCPVTNEAKTHFALKYGSAKWL
jgi:antitoxin component YwqK of YwqJK toxin-antitoxin module